jgi:hypothetical protein
MSCTYVNRGLCILLDLRCLVNIALPGSSGLGRARSKIDVSVGGALLDGMELKPWRLCRRENEWGFVHCKGFLRMNVSVH